MNILDGSMDLVSVGLVEKAEGGGTQIIMTIPVTEVGCIVDIIAVITDEVSVTHTQHSHMEIANTGDHTTVKNRWVNFHMYITKKMEFLPVTGLKLVSNLI